MPLPYFLHVNSRPKPDSGVDNKLWEKWYITEHLPDLVNSGTTKRAAFYRETFDFPLAPEERSPRAYLAVYQTDFEDALSSSEFANNVRHGSDLFPTKRETTENGDFDARNYKLIMDYDPKKTGESAPPFLVTVEMEPVDEADLDKWYQEEHLEMLSKMPGYRRSSRYVLGPKTPITLGEPGRFLALHELDDLHAASFSEESAAANTTPWSVKHIQGSKVFIARGWELLHSEGF
ncbi:hypothetical protein LTR84_000270 [Exophiala bonariae]|uniref:EthD domain-containing protein n=1 Tax=Exophiala bonariae TaxID=1690606 RepID=A0AAV9NQG9_9EURO|nr:hypothetical protein LTR84_000270 [Exophiala bonariae]